MAESRIPSAIPGKQAQRMKMETPARSCELCMSVPSEAVSLGLETSPGTISLCPPRHTTRWVLSIIPFFQTGGLEYRKVKLLAGNLGK